MTIVSEWAGRTRLVAALLLLGVFLTGGVAGAAANHLVSSRDRTAFALRYEQSDERGPRGRRGSSPGERSPAGMLEQRLDLTPEQRQGMEQIFDARRRRIETVLRDIEPRLQAQRDSTDVEIRTLLTVEQVQEFDQLVAERREVSRGFGGPPSRP